MVHVFVERRFEPPLTGGDVIAMALKSGGCFGLYKIDWIESLLSLDGRNMICHFTSPDTESVRVAFRQTGSDSSCLWPGTVHSMNLSLTPTIAVERRFDAPVALDDIQAIEDRGAWCLEARGVIFDRTYFSTDRKRLLCLYQAPDAEAVRQAQTQAQMPMDRVWAFQRLGPWNIPRA